MSLQTLQRQYNDVAPFYDLDPQGVTQQSLDLAVEQLSHQHLMTNGEARREVLDLGMGTGLFLGKLKAIGGEHFRTSSVVIWPKAWSRKRVVEFPT